MQTYLSVATRLTGVALVMALFSACTSISLPTQLTENRGGYEFDESRTTFGERLALSEAGFKTRIDGVSSYAPR